MDDAEELRSLIVRTEQLQFLDDDSLHQIRLAAESIARRSAGGHYVAKLGELRFYSPVTTTGTDHRPAWTWGCTQLKNLLAAMLSDITRAAAGSHGGSVLVAENKHKASGKKGKPVPGYEIRRDILVGPWRTVRPCGRGGQGEVWQVKREGVAHAPPHALKACLSQDAQALRRFRTEVELLSGQKHEHVVPVVEARLEWVSGDDDVGCPYLVMPLAQGSIDTIGWLQHDPASMVDLFRQACEAIVHLHSQAPPILHRDLKPENILIVEEPFKAVISDFGVAAEEPQQGAHTAIGEVVGSRLYRAPEILAGSPHTVASDIYSLGRILERLLTGTASSGPNAAPVPRGRRLGPDACLALDRLIARAVAWHPDQRYPNVRALLEDVPALTVDTRPQKSGNRLDPDVVATDAGSPDDIAKLTKSEWNLVAQELTSSIRDKRKAIQVDAEQRGVGGQTWSPEAEMIVAHAESLTREVLRRMEAQEEKVRAELRGEPYWMGVEGVLLPNARQFLRGHLGAIEQNARVRGLGSGGLDLGLTLVQQQAESTLAHMIQTYTRARALRHKLGPA